MWTIVFTSVPLCDKERTDFCCCYRSLLHSLTSVKQQYHHLFEQCETEVLTEVLLESQRFWNVMLCCLVSG
jgi:hypothetical protein